MKINIKTNKNFNNENLFGSVYVISLKAVKVGTETDFDWKNHGTGCPGEFSGEGYRKGITETYE